MSVDSMLQGLADKLGELFALQEERTRAQIAAGVAETRNAVRLRGARAVPAARGSLNAGPGRLMGWSLQNTGAAAATVRLVDGRPDTSGDVLAVLVLAVGATATHSIPVGVSITEALSLELDGATTLTGSVYLGAVD